MLFGLKLELEQLQLEQLQRKRAQCLCGLLPGKLVVFFVLLFVFVFVFLFVLRDESVQQWHVDGVAPGLYRQRANVCGYQVVRQWI